MCYLSFIVVIFALINCTQLFSQNTTPTIVWEKRFNGQDRIGNDRFWIARNLCLSLDNSLLISGSTYFPNAVYCMKATIEGNEQWSQKLGDSASPYFDEVNSQFFEKPFGSYSLMSPYLYSNYAKIGYYFLRQFDGNGAKIKDLFSIGSDTGGSFSDVSVFGKLENNDWIIASMTTGGDAKPFGAYYLKKITQEGTAKWKKWFVKSDSISVMPLAVQSTLDGGCVLIGSTFVKDNYTQSEFFVQKFDSLGNSSWSNVIHESMGNGYGQAKIIEVADGYVFGGSSTSITEGINRGRSSFIIGKLDKNGTLIWKKPYRDTVNYQFYLYNLLLTQDKGFVACGMANFGSWDNSEDFFMVKTDANGKQEWQKTWGTDTTDYLTGVAQLNDGDYIVSGHSVDAAYLARIHPEQISGIKELSRSILPESVVIPNPAYSSVSIFFPFKSFNSDIKPELFDGLGRKVCDVIISSEDNKLKATFDVSSLPKGIYVARLTDGSHINSAKVMVTH